MGHKSSGLIVLAYPSLEYPEVGELVQFSPSLETPEAGRGADEALLHSGSGLAAPIPLTCRWRPLPPIRLG